MLEKEDEMKWMQIGPGVVENQEKTSWRFKNSNQLIFGLLTKDEVGMAGSRAINEYERAGNKIAAEITRKSLKEILESFD